MSTPSPSISIDVEQNLLTVKAERRTTAADDERAGDVLIGERPSGTFSRQLFLGETLDTDRIEASYDAGVLRLTIPVAEKAKPRKIEISSGNGSRKEIDA